MANFDISVATLSAVRREAKALRQFADAKEVDAETNRAIASSSNDVSLPAANDRCASAGVILEIIPGIRSS